MFVILKIMIENVVKEMDLICIYCEEIVECINYVMDLFNVVIDLVVEMNNLNIFIVILVME